MLRELRRRAAIRIRSAAGRHRWAAPPVVGYALASAWLTHRLWVHPSHLVPADNPTDTANFAWFLTATPWSIAHGHSPVFTHLINAPAGVNLMWNTSMPLIGFLFAPLTYAFGAPWVVTLLESLGPFLSALSGLVVVRKLGAARLPAVLAGLFYGFSPAMTAKSLGHVNLTMQPLLPVMLLLGVRLVSSPATRRRDGVLLGLAAALQLFINEELLLLTGLALVLVIAVLALQRGIVWREQLASARAYLLALVVFGLLGGPLLLFQVFGPQHGTGAPYTVSYFKVDLSSYVVPSRLQLLASAASKRESARFTGGIAEQTAYLGWPLLLFALLALVLCWRAVRVRATLIPAAVLGLLALGPVLAIGGKDTKHHLPWGWVTHLPLAENALASRLPLLTDLLLAAGLCFALDELMRRHRPAAIVAAGCWVLGLVTVIPAAVTPAPTAPVPAFFTSKAVHGLARNGTVLVLPFPTATVTDPVRWQAASGMAYRMPGGYFIGPADSGRLYVGGQPRYSQLVLETIGVQGVSPQVTPALRAQVMTDLGYWQTESVVLGPTPHAAELASFMAAVLGSPPRPEGGVLVWKVAQSP